LEAAIASDIASHILPVLGLLNITETVGWCERVGVDRLD
jgi:hypothetical protein